MGNKRFSHKRIPIKNEEIKDSESKNGENSSVVVELLIMKTEFLITSSLWVEYRGCWAYTGSLLRITWW